MDFGAGLGRKAATQILPCDWPADLGQEKPTDPASKSAQDAHQFFSAYDLSREVPELYGVCVCVACTSKLGHEEMDQLARHLLDQAQLLAGCCRRLPFLWSKRYLSEP